MTVLALRSRQPQSLADLLDAHGREIQAVAYLILRERFLAEDVTIETLLTAFLKGRLYPRRGGAQGVAAPGRHEQGPQPSTFVISDRDDARMVGAARAG